MEANKSRSWFATKYEVRRVCIEKSDRNLRLSYELYTQVDLGYRLRMPNQNIDIQRFPELVHAAGFRGYYLSANDVR